LEIRRRCTSMNQFPLCGNFCCHEIDFRIVDSFGADVAIPSVKEQCLGAYCFQFRERSVVFSSAAFSG
jgi:hypothetical protein